MSSPAERIFEDEAPLIIKGRTSKAVTASASGEMLVSGTATIHLRFGPDGTVIEKHTRRIRPLHRTGGAATMDMRGVHPAEGE